MKKPPSSYHIKVNGKELSEADLNTKIVTDEAFRDQLDTSIDAKLSDLTKMESDCQKFYDAKVCKRIIAKPRKIYANLKKKIKKSKSKAEKNKK